jgi:hypothetical protein
MAITGVAWNVFGKPPSELNQWLVRNLDLYCLSEVAPNDLSRFPKHLGDRYHAIPGETGNGQRLEIVYSDRLKLVESRPLNSINFLRTGKDPLYALFECEGEHFWVICVHLPRRNFVYRWIHGYLLKRFASNQMHPGAIIGDANCDLKESGESDRVFKILTSKGGLIYAAPDKFIPTHCSKHRSILDAVFYKGFTDVRVDILHSQGEYCTNGYASDHRPIQFTLDNHSGETTVANTNANLREKNAHLEAELEAARKQNEQYESYLDAKTAPSIKLKPTRVPVDFGNSVVPSYGSGEYFHPAAQLLESKGFTWQSVLQSIVVAIFAGLAWRFANNVTLPSFTLPVIPWDSINSVPAVNIDPAIASVVVLKILVALLSATVIALFSATAIRWVSFRLTELKDNLVIVASSVAISIVTILSLAIVYKLI